VPSTTWTPRALASSVKEFSSDLWRVVEAQHIASTMRLVESLADQAVLEEVLEESKPKVPRDAARLHYLLSTPCRYRPSVGSRFRAAFDAGVWYGAEELRTAMAEKSYWRLRFLLDSPGTPDLGPVPHTAFTAAVRGPALDLTMPPLVRDKERWTHPTDYAPTQALAAAVREAQVQVLRYESVRDIEQAACAAVLTPRAFARSSPKRQETWFIAAARTRVRCSGEGRTGWEFESEQLLGA
jgi:hypothetical protein